MNEPNLEPIDKIKVPELKVKKELTKSDLWSLGIIMLLMLVLFGFGMYAQHLETQYNECAIEYNECSSNCMLYKNEEVKQNGRFIPTVVVGNQTD
jgi:hypothetical protein